MTWLLWGSSIWAVILAFFFVDAPTLLANLLNRRTGGAR